MLPPNVCALPFPVKFKSPLLWLSVPLLVRLPSKSVSTEERVNVFVLLIIMLLKLVIAVPEMVVVPLNVTSLVL